MLYDREVAISERSVKPADILHNPQLILGRQIINILPEGSAVINPEKVPICLQPDSSTTSILPIQINQTVPTTIQLLRFDFDNNEPEYLTIGSREIKRMRASALRHVGKDTSQPLILNYAVKKSGLYRLGEVVDETKLVVQHPLTETYVVKCPSAKVIHAGKTRCKGDMSNIALHVEGTPPFKLKYRKIVNGHDRDVSYQSVQPDNFVSPLLRLKGSGPLTQYGDNNLDWAQVQTVVVSLNETVSQSGEWTYTIEEVTDVFNNVQSYVRTSEDYELPKHRADRIEDGFIVLERPRAALDPGHKRTIEPIRAARGQSVEIPVSLLHHDVHEPSDQEYAVTYEFTPEAEIRADGGPSSGTIGENFKIKRGGQLPRVKAPGLYRLSTIATDKCAGQVDEPSMLQIINPPEPQVEISNETIHDSCAGRNIGLRVNFDFSGTPPFTIGYTVRNQQSKALTHQSRTFDSPRGTIELRPDEAGSFEYQFLELSDNVYSRQDLKSRKLKLQQSVKPSVSASFVSTSSKQGVCLDDTVTHSVKLSGEGPWKLEYELVHGKKREKHTVESEDDRITIQSRSLTSGGEYSLALLGVTDKMGCREALTQDAKIFVRHQKPRAAFGFIDGRQSIKILESKTVDLPLRLSGDGPWEIEYEYKKPGSERSQALGKERARNNNDIISVRQEGTYEIKSVRDARCPGSVDEKSSKFDVAFIPRPHILPSEAPQHTIWEDRIMRNAVCEGDEDAIVLALRGTPPFEIGYVENIRPEKGSNVVNPRSLNVPGNTAEIQLDTHRAGTYQYSFSKLGDNNYDSDMRHHSPLSIEQQVYARPTAAFASPGKVYSFCQGENISPEESEKIPVVLTGQPPFTVDVEIKHHGRASRGTPHSFSNLGHHKSEITIPHRYLQTGNSFVSIRRVVDSRGCERLVDPINAPRVQISVHDSPSIASSETDRHHYCVGDRIAFALSGIAPFEIKYTFEGSPRRATSSTPTFRRLAERPGNFTIDAISDAGSSCQTRASISKQIHELPSVRVSKGKESRVDIHAGGSTNITFDFGGTPPFKFTLLRSENAKKGRPGSEHGTVLETMMMESSGNSLTKTVSQEGTYEVTALEDRFCAFALPGHEGELAKFKGERS